MNATTQTMTATPATASPVQPITITGPAPMIIDPANLKRRPVLTAEEARMLTTEIQRTSVRLWLLVTEAHDRVAHFALGYDSWDDYVRSEFKMSPSRSYQLLDTGHVMRELAIAGVDIDAAAPPPARVVARVKDRLPEVRRLAKQAIKDGVRFDDALRDLARQPRSTDRVAGAAVVKPDGSPATVHGEKDVGTKADGRKTALLTCPACDGQGKVSRSLAGRLRGFIKTLG